ncbi:MAG: 2-succinyl-6-hydroxy-2,4-cyclohexadiene-1-carboxylate synthase [Longimicrobiales bacterium]
MTRATRYPVMVHGFTGSSASWGPRLIDGLAGAGLTPVTVDLPGHGADIGAIDPARFTLAAALERVGGAGAWPEDLIGYSMGGRIALHFAAAYPNRVRRLVLESASPGLVLEAERDARRRSDDDLAKRIEAEGIAWFTEFWESQPLFESRWRADPRDLARQSELRMRNDPRSLAAALTGLGSGRLPSLWHDLDRIGTPTLLLAGALDVKYVEVAERMCAAMPAAKLAIVPGAGHTVHLEAPEAWLDAVTGFLTA